MSKIKRWWYGSYSTLSRGEREFLLVLGAWVVSLSLFCGGLFLLTGCIKKPTERRGIPPGVAITCDDTSYRSSTCVGDDAKVYICIQSRDDGVVHCAPSPTVPR